MASRLLAEGAPTASAGFVTCPNGRGVAGRWQERLTGEMTAHLAAAGVRVPPGFATTADAYEELLDGHGLRARIEEQIDRLHDGVALDEVCTVRETCHRSPHRVRGGVHSVRTNRWGSEPPPT